MPDFKKVVEKVLLPLQLSLGLFLIMKTTPLWAVIHCALASLLNFFHFPYTDYKQLGDFQGRVFKKVISHATTAGDVLKLKNQNDAQESKKEGKSENDGSVSGEYLGKKFELERKDGNRMLMKDGRAYYITDKMWETVQYIGKVGKGTVFVKNHKEIWEEVVTGDIMEFEEVLDSVILDNRAIVRLDHDYFLPVNLLLAEDKLQKTLNFVALFLKTQKNIYWLIPALLTFTAAVMGFSTTLRLSIVDCIGKFCCRGIRWVCDLLPLPIRRRVYYWGSWVERLKPGNDFQSKIVRGDISVLIAGGAKFYSQSLVGPITFADRSVEKISSGGGPFLFKCESKSDSNSHSVFIEWIFDISQQKCLLKADRVGSKEVRLSLKEVETFIECCDGHCSKEIKFFKSGCYKANRSSMANDSHTASVDIDCCKAKESLMAGDIHTASVDIDCSAEEARKLFIFAAYMAELQSGSLRSCDRNSKTLYVRRFIDSINAYVRSGYPPFHLLELKGVVVR
ncbi:hypothetical protein SUGI_0096320 [Cryptomeria japonica]|nr:hypothetical protein SUGI_0096320 [Cryptomeria japonica]